MGSYEDLCGEVTLPIKALARAKPAGPEKGIFPRSTCAPKRGKEIKSRPCSSVYLVGKQ